MKIGYGKTFEKQSILKSFKGYCFVGTQLFVFVLCLPTILLVLFSKTKVFCVQFCFNNLISQNTQVYLHLERHLLLQLYPPSVCLTAIFQSHHTCVCQCGDQFIVNISIFVVIIIVPRIKQNCISAHWFLSIDPLRVPICAVMGESRFFGEYFFYILIYQCFLWSINVGK